MLYRRRAGIARRNSRPVALAIGIILAALSLHLGWTLYGAKIFGFGPEARAQGERCPNPRPVNTFTGSGPQETPPFQINTPSFRVSYDARGADGSSGSLEVDVVPEEEQDVAVGEPIQQRGPGSGDAFVDEGPGSFFLDIISSDIDYTITVEECSGGGDTTGPTPPPSPPRPTPQTTPEPAPPRPELPSPQPQPNPPLMKAGAPPKGPVPAMPGGQCPKEFPISKGGACYR